MSEKKNNGWRFVPSLYLYQGIPSCVVMQTATLMYASMGVEKSSFAFWTSIVSLPWTLKPLLSPAVERYGTKRSWVLWTEVIMGVLFVLLGLSMTGSNFYSMSLIMMGIVAVFSSMHDAACDGYYMMALDQKQQSFFVGIRSTFYRIATIASTGLIPFVAGSLSEGTGDGYGWSVALIGAGVVLMLLWGYNNVGVPKIKEETGRQDNGLEIFWRALKSFFTHEGVVAAVSFFLLYRLGEAFLTKVLTAFLVDARENGGIGLSVEACGIVYGTAGVFSLVVGGILGGLAAAKYGLKRVIWVMAIAMNLPNLGYVLLAHYQPMADSAWVWTAVIVEQFGYGFGFAAYMLYMLRYVGQAEYKAAEYSVGTALMTLGLLLPGMGAGWLCEAVGYEYFFVVALALTIPGMLVITQLRWGEK
ncbi:MAG: MFS transporter [Bacteroidales bacterium]|nr:MFS transporter [Bacteroidales bacterium]